MLEIKNLHAGIEGTPILKGLNLSVNAGEVHAIMGPNGSGKSTLAKVVAGHPQYAVTEGQVLYEVNFKKINLLELEPEDRAREGVFMAFQYPVEIPGVNASMFLRAAFNEICKHQGAEEMDPIEFDEYLRKKMKLLDMDEKFINRPVNVDFSGGEKKRNEILQMAVLNPRLMVLDETDSGLDIDSMRIVADGVNKLRNKNNAVIVITHYQRLLNYIVPDFVHILHDGKIIKSQGKELALEVEDKGYDWLIK
ncbi:MAG: Fe-S cluster assembly ATPase SufC [Omnitrophica WOR_2 bacterium RIFCSPHIGHO2_01_FULL_48_9]|nr:MAG: Fe-S cluster assembly ATPase SufC [Omnitrophica WOR_2 bacterium RIFCSPHIGHO2_02_FULL_48_11]OGX33724.1 MAG: Fe-S cluster assembly ATPase SufC [Omnitrophica WOR_2 bacterium RIFCSPHIGHO2_01_FULL_48_9]